MKILSIDSPTFVDDFNKALEIKPGEKVSVSGPQFERTDGVQVPVPDFKLADWEALPTRDEATLKALGFGVWEKSKYQTHWLYPKEWYAIIPNGLAIVQIDGSSETFERGKTDDDYRFGCLSFGFIQRTV